MLEPHSTREATAPAQRENLIKRLIIGRARDLSDHSLFHKLSLIAVLAWVGLGSDGLSSSCYGPEECVKALGPHLSFAPFVGLATVITIAIICASYSQIIELFPTGGGGYLVASKLLSPTAGVVSGCALVVDYVLTIAISIASGADQLFSVLPSAWVGWKMAVIISATIFLTIMNLRGVKESVVVWAPIFFVFLATHGFAVLYALCTHLGDFPAIVHQTTTDIHDTHAQLGWMGILLLLIKSYSLGAGSYTGIEAVSNGLPILREPRVKTGKRTMIYMGTSLAFMVGGLLIAYVFYQALPVEGKTLNAVLFEKMTATWPQSASVTFVWVAMVSAAALLFIAAQTGFLDGPRVLANMALDRWFPARFATLSDRFVAQNGIILMGMAALALILVSHGQVDWLVVLYSINVFVTFSLSQLGMMRHWWSERNQGGKWRLPLLINSVGFLLTFSILVILSCMKFQEGGWVTVIVTGILIWIAFQIKKHYQETQVQLARLDDMVEAFRTPGIMEGPGLAFDPKARTAVVFVNGFNGLGVHTTLGIMRHFNKVFTNFVFVEIGVVDAGNFKGQEEITHLRSSVGSQVGRYVEIMRSHGFHAESVSAVGTEIVSTASDLSGTIIEKYPFCTFFGGQLVFNNETYFTRWLHNFTVFTMQREFFKRGRPFFVMPIRV